MARTERAPFPAPVRQPGVNAAVFSRAFWRALAEKSALAAAAGASAGALAYGLLSGLRPVVFEHLRAFGPLHRYLLHRSVAFVRTFGEVVNDSLAFILLGLCLPPAIVWAATFTSKCWVRNPRRLLLASALGALGGGIGMFCMQRFLINPPDLPVPRFGRETSMALTWALIGPWFGVAISTGLQRFPLTHGLFAGAAAGWSTGAIWVVLSLYRTDLKGLLRFPLAGLLFGLCVVGVGAVAAVTRYRRRD